MSWRTAAGASVLAALLAGVDAAGAGLPVAFAGKFKTEQQIQGPDCLALKWSQKPGDPYGCTEVQLAQWRQALIDWRQRRRAELRDGAGSRPDPYANPALQWTQRSFVQPQAMLHDRLLYDPVARRYTARRYLADVRARFGGIDSVLLWSGYPNLGIDPRNQIDLLLDLPGGRDGLRSLVADFRRHGVRVLFPALPWDSGSAPLARPLPEVTARLMVDLGADGINGDTMTGVPAAYTEAAERAGAALAFEPEIAPLEDQLPWNPMSWGYFDYAYRELTPALFVSRLKWFEPRHMVHVSDRWQRQRRDMLQAAFFNGTGMQSWENVWGFWNGFTPRDGEALRRIATIQRAMAAQLVSPDWEPMTPTRQRGVLASRWPLPAGTLWTLVNRNSYAVNGHQLTLPASGAALRWFDLYHGVELKPERAQGEASALAFDIEADGFGAIYATASPTSDLHTLLATMRAATRKPLAAFSDVWRPLQQQMVRQPATAAAAASAAPPDGMTAIPEHQHFEFRVHGVEVEGLDQPGIDVQFPWEDTPRRFHDRTLTVPAFNIDTYPVTNAQYRRFLDATGWRPEDAHNFLRHWQHGAPRAEDADTPVTWVSQDDARAYARWAGKRLPRSWEWQLAAQGSDGRAFPWGDAWDAAAVPEPRNAGNFDGPARVDAHPRGASPFGVMDLVGNVWQWTDEFVDAHTRAAVLRGGSRFRPEGAHWYFPQALRLDEHGKYLLMAPSLDRASTIGFRCVQDVSARVASVARAGKPVAAAGR